MGETKSTGKEEPKMLPSDLKLRLMAFKSSLELGKMVNQHLLRMHNLDAEQSTFLINAKESWFNDGHQKVELLDTVRSKDVYFLTDIGNYSIEYTMHGFTNHASPNDLAQQLKDGIGSCKCHTNSISIIMPLLFAGRQHRRKGREALSCATFLHEIDKHCGINRLLTFDAHDEGVQQAMFDTEFDNFYASNVILKDFITAASKEELEDIIFVAPDYGAMGRTTFYLNSFNSPFIKRSSGSFYKERDCNNMVDGKYPVIRHEYSGKDDIKGKTALIIDDMIASGGSMIDVIDGLNERGVSNIYIICTYTLFTEGVEKFNQYFNEGKLSGIYTTNLSYIPKEYAELEWLHVVDCSEYIAQIIYNLQNDKSISTLLNDRSYPCQLLEKKFRNEII